MNFMFTVGSGFTTTPPAGDSFSILQEQQIRSTAANGPTGVLENVTEGSLLVCLVSYFSAAPGGLTVSDDNGNTWATNEHTFNATNGVAIAYAMDANAGTTTLTVTASGDPDFYITAIAMECAGMATASALDVDTSNTGTGTTADTGTTAETTQANAVAFAVFGDASANTMAIPAGWEELDLNNDSSSFQPISASYKELSATGTQSASFTDAQLAEWAAAIAVFKKAA